ncbi:MAG TPA: CDP-diacylglycerol--glycerol-3-phosphate 3-phosphatidyltransferase [Solirubrobacterales bacterium]|jgi:CDP-diacylglycerol--glycerol-3-phosphate 3-phosphatidyltransferase|nr:CDP-diacylglycerol--glycerol-3-phosphate 3-phosphatidyltransferase [Solirubrobacterales bacterium]
MREQTNLPNVLTLLRILLVPVVILALLKESDSGDAVAAVAFAIAGTTDWFDGYLARSRNLVTSFGKVMDPVADKLLITGTLITLSALDEFPVVATALILFREFAVSALRIVVADNGGRVISASQYGKIKTVLQMFAVLAVIIDGPGGWVDVLIWITVAVTLATGLDYFLNVRKRIDRPAAEGSDA